MSPMAAYLLSRVVVIVCILLVTCNSITDAGRTSNLSSWKLEDQNRVKQFNKSPVKTIKSPDGDIIDCVHIAHQPTLNHPLLKNHTIQMRPNRLNRAFVTNKVDTKRSKPITQLWHVSGRCPTGSIPIRRRTKKDDIFRASSAKTFEATHSLDLVTLKPTQCAVVYVEGDEEFYGATATMNVWNPLVQTSSEYSSSHVWLRGRSSDDHLTGFKAGWQVFPDLYADNKTRLFIYSFTGVDTGCYDLDCPGFVQVSNKIALGARIVPISSYEGHQYDITIHIERDEISGDWWLLYGNEDDVVGYWRKDFFPDLYAGASMIQWGGEVVNSESGGMHTTTQMGSGHFPEAGLGHASYFRNLQIVNASYFFNPPKQLFNFTQQPTCYNIRTFKFPYGENYFYYGGPGRNANCQ